MPLVDLMNVAEHNLLGSLQTVGFHDVAVINQLHVTLATISLM